MAILFFHTQQPSIFEKIALSVKNPGEGFALQKIAAKREEESYPVWLHFFMYDTIFSGEAI